MITYTTKINRVLTVNTDSLQDVVKQVDFTVTGEDQGTKFELNSSMKLSDPDPSTFISFKDLTEAQVVAWLDSNQGVMEPLKNHIKYIVEKQVEESKLQEKALPWAPAPTPAPASTT